MQAASRHGTPSLKSLPKDGGVSCCSRSSGRSPIQFLTVQLIELTGPVGHSSRSITTTMVNMVRNVISRIQCMYIDSVYIYMFALTW